MYLFNGYHSLISTLLPSFPIPFWSSFECWLVHRSSPRRNFSQQLGRVKHGILLYWCVFCTRFIRERFLMEDFLLSNWKRYRYFSLWLWNSFLLARVDCFVSFGYARDGSQGLVCLGKHSYLWAIFPDPKQVFCRFLFCFSYCMPIFWNLLYEKLGSPVLKTCDVFF